MKSDVSGVAGAVRVIQLTMAGLTRAELHGKRLDATGKSRAITDDPPITTSGLDLNELHEAHIKGAFVPRAKSKAMHVIVQFPKDLVDGSDAQGMLHHAREFGKQVFGDEAIFADRIDRDEKSQHVVDLFVAPRYLKRTKHDEKVAVSMTRHLKAIAEKYDHPPIPHGIGRALQDAWFEYLRDEMRLKEVKRGSAKQIPGPDWKSAEQLRAEELAAMQAEAERARDDGRDAGYAEGISKAAQENDVRQRGLNELERQLDIQRADQITERVRLASANSKAERQAGETRRKAEADANAVREQAEADAKTAREEAEADAKATREKAEAEAGEIKSAAEREGREKGLADARALIRLDQEAAAKAKVAAAKEYDAAAADREAAAAERAEAKAAGLAEARVLIRNEQDVAKSDRDAAAAERAAAATERAGAKAAGLAEAAQELSSRKTALDLRESAVAAREADAEAEGAKATALKVGVEAWAAGDILQAVRKDGQPGFVWRDEATKQRIRPLIIPAWNEVWETVTALAARLSERVAAIEVAAKQKARELVDGAGEAVKTFMARYEAASDAERARLSRTPSFAAVTELANDQAVQAAIEAPGNSEVDDALVRAAAAGLAKGVKLPGGGTGLGA